MTATNDARALYLDLMKRVLVNWIYGNSEVAYVPAPETASKGKTVFDFFSAQGLRVVRPMPMDPARRAQGDDWPPTAHSMIGFKRLDNIQHCVENVLADKVPGDLIETGVWRGGATIFMRAILKAYGVEDRTIWVADSFKGLPEPDARTYPLDATSELHAIDILAVPAEEVKANFDRYGLLDDQVRFLEGWFRDTLPHAPMDQLAVMRLDGDMYESTMDALTHLYPKLSVGGYVIIDDFGIEACREAVHEYRNRQGIRDEILEIDWIGAYWRRSA